MRDPRCVSHQQETSSRAPPADTSQPFPPLLRGSSPLSNQVSAKEEVSSLNLSSDQTQFSANRQARVLRTRRSMTAAWQKTKLSPFQNIETSRIERRRIEASTLHRLLLDILTTFQNLLKALVKVQSRIAKNWTVPPQPARGCMKNTVDEVLSLTAFLVTLLKSIGLFARNILNFLATAIKESHGLDHHVEPGNLQSVLLGLSSIHSRFVEFRDSVENLGMNLSSSSTAFETAMHPDRNRTDLSPSKATLDLASAHSMLSSSILALTKHLETLEVPSWNPTLLSPFDVKETAGSWKAIENLSVEVMPRMRTTVDRLVDGTIGDRFTARKEENQLLENSLRIFREE